MHPMKVLFAFLLFGSPAMAQWSADAGTNLAVVTANGHQALPMSAATPDHGRWVGWFDDATDCYFAQRYDSQGREMLPPGGILVSDHLQVPYRLDWDLMTTANGDVVIAITDTRNGGDLDVYAYRIDADGNFLWGADGVVVSDNSEREEGPQIAEVSNGDIVVVWNYFVGEIRMQRLTATGIPLLAMAGKTIGFEPNALPGFARVIPSYGLGVIVSWIRSTSSSSDIIHLRAQAFDAAGNPIWALPVEVHDAFNLTLPFGQQLISDGSGGAVLCWQARNPNRSLLFDAFVQHISGAGAELLPHGGVLLSNAGGLNHLDPYATFNASTGDIIAFWSENDRLLQQSGWYAQSVSPLGNLRWGSTGKQILPIDSSTKRLSFAEPIGDGALGMISWAPLGGYGADQIIATRLDAAGNELWGAPIEVKTTQSNQAPQLSLSIDQTKQAVVFWTDGRNGSDDIYGQNIHADGTLGTDYLQVDVSNISLSAGGTAQLSLDAGMSHAGETYVVLGSNTGTAPGLNGRGLHLDLNDGPYFQLTLTNPTHSLFTSFRGTLNSQGRANASVTFPAGTNPAYANSVLGHAFAVLGAGGLGALASETESFTLLP